MAEWSFVDLDELVDTYQCPVGATGTVTIILPTQLVCQVTFGPIRDGSDEDITVAGALAFSDRLLGQVASFNSSANAPYKRRRLGAGNTYAVNLPGGDQPRVRYAVVTAPANSVLEITFDAPPGVS